MTYMILQDIPTEIKRIDQSGREIIVKRYKRSQSIRSTVPSLSDLSKGKIQPHVPIKTKALANPYHTISVDLMGPYSKTSTQKLFILVIANKTLK